MPARSLHVTGHWNPLDSWYYDSVYKEYQDWYADGTTNISCEISDLKEGTNDIYVSCKDMNGNKDTNETNAHLQYTKVTPATAYVTANNEVMVSLGAIAVVTALAAVYLALTRIERINKKSQKPSGD